MENEQVDMGNLNDDGIDRKNFIKCMAWAGTGVLWMMSGGIMKSFGMSQMIDKNTGGLKKGLILPKGDFGFVQISDSHIGFSKPANTDVLGTLNAAISKINAMPVTPGWRDSSATLSHRAVPRELGKRATLTNCSERSIETDDLHPVGAFSGRVLADGLERAARLLDRIDRNGFRFFPARDQEPALGIDRESARLALGGRA